MLLCGEPVVDGKAQTRGSSSLWVSKGIPWREGRFLPGDQDVVGRTQSDPYIQGRASVREVPGPDGRGRRVEGSNG